MVNLELATNEELIRELANRTTFAGVIVYSSDNHKRPGQKHENFLTVSTVCDESTVRLLHKVLEAFNCEEA